MGPRVTLDSGALSALASGHVGVRADLRVLQRRGVQAVVPAPVLAECVSGNGPGMPTPVGCRLSTPASGSLAGRACSGTPRRVPDPQWMLSLSRPLSRTAVDWSSPAIRLTYALLPSRQVWSSGHCPDRPSLPMLTLAIARVALLRSWDAAW